MSTPAPFGRISGNVWHMTVAEFISAARAMPLSAHASDSSWAGGNWRESIETLAHGGSDRLASLASPLVDQIAAAFPATTARRVVYSETGGSFDLGAAMRGEPNSFRRRAKIESPRNPLTICANNVSSAGISAEIMRKRASAIVALAMAANMTRPVSVNFVISAQGNQTAATNRDFIKAGHLSICVNASMPLSIAEIASLFCDYPLTRSVGYGLVAWAYSGFASHVGYRGIKWPRAVESMSQDAINGFAKSETRNLYPLSSEADSVSIPGMMIGAEKEFSDPIAWVAREMARLGL